MPNRRSSDGKMNWFPAGFATVFFHTSIVGPASFMSARCQNHPQAGFGERIYSIRVVVSEQKKYFKSPIFFSSGEANLGECRSVHSGCRRSGIVNLHARQESRSGL